jgi:serine O-acetyltransferase
MSVPKTFFDSLSRRKAGILPRLPDKEASEEFINHLYRYLFLPVPDETRSAGDLADGFEQLQVHLSNILIDIFEDENETEQIAASFFSKIPEVYDTLLRDADAFLKFDPAARSHEEVVLAYPGFFAIAVYRFANALHQLEVPLLPRILTEYAHGRTGVDIHPGAKISDSFLIDHGTGVVIGESAVIGKNVVIYQGVTLGALHVSKEMASVKRHPTIEDNVIIYSGATILGGQTVIGRNSIIGGNVWLTNSVNPDSVVYQKSEVIVRTKYPENEFLNFVI